MAGFKKQSLEAWIHEVRNDSEREEPCIALALVYLKGMNKEEPVWDVKFKAGGKQWSDKDLANVFQNKAETTVQDFPGVHTFNLHAFYEKTDEPRKRTFTVRTQDEDGGLVTENPTPTGALQQIMRQKETLFVQMMQQTTAMARQSNDMVETMGTMFVQMGRAAAEERQASAAQARESRESFEIIREMLMKQISDNREHELKTLEYQRSTEERRKLLGYAPLLVNTVTGKEIFPQSTADTALIEAIAAAFDKMSDDQIMGMGSTLPPELFGPLMARFTKWKKDQEEDQKRIAALSPPIRDPEAEAGGDIQPSIMAVGSDSTRKDDK